MTAVSPKPHTKKNCFGVSQTTARASCDSLASTRVPSSVRQAGLRDSCSSGPIQASPRTLTFGSRTALRAEARLQPRTVSSGVFSPPSRKAGGVGVLRSGNLGNVMGNAAPSGGGGGIEKLTERSRFGSSFNSDTDTWASSPLSQGCKENLYPYPRHGMTSNLEKGSGCAYHERMGNRLSMPELAMPSVPWPVSGRTSCASGATRRRGPSQSPPLQSLRSKRRTSTPWLL